MLNFKNKKILNKKNDQAGFSIIETLVAIFILLISITGPMVFAQSSLRVAFQARDQVTAFYLAQDAIEYIKNRREHFALSQGGGHWLGNDINDKCIENHGCTIDTTTSDYSNAVKECFTAEPGCIDSGITDTPLKIDSTYNYFGFEGDDSLFFRNIYIEEVEPGEVQVVVKVKWTSHDSIGSREIIVAENIFNWPNILLGNN